MLVAASPTTPVFEASVLACEACFSSLDIHAGRFETALLLVSTPITRFCSLVLWSEGVGLLEVSSDFFSSPSWFALVAPVSAVLLLAFFFFFASASAAAVSAAAFSFAAAAFLSESMILLSFCVT